MEIISLIILPIISLAVLFLLTKLMGYRQVTQLSMYDYIIGITIGSIAAEMVMSDFSDILKPLLGMIVYAVVTVCLSFISSSSLKMRKLIEGKAVILYENNYLYNEELKKAKMDIDEFLMQCRINGYFELNQLDTVVLETNGNLSFNPKEKYRPTQVQDVKDKATEKNLPVVLIKEGKVYQEHLKKIGQDEKWLQSQIQAKGMKIEDIILMYYENNGHLQIYEFNHKKRDFI